MVRRDVGVRTLGGVVASIMRELEEDVGDVGRPARLA